MSNTEQTIDVLRRIDERLKQVVALSALPLISGMKQKDAIERLGAVGLDAASISEITGFPVTSVAPVLSRAKKGKKLS